MGKVFPGQPWRPPTAAQRNGWDESADFYNLKNRRRDNPTKRKPIPTDLIKLRNDSGDELAAGRVLEIGAKLITTPTRGSLWFEGVTPAPNGTKGIAVSIRQMVDNAIDWFQVSGVCLAKVNINHEQQTRADVDSSSTLLQSKWYGRVEILQKFATGTGEKECLIRIGEMFRGPIKVIITQSGGIAPNGNGTAKVRWAGADASPTSTLQVYYTHMPGPNNAGQNKYASVFWEPDEQKFVIHNLQC